MMTTNNNIASVRTLAPVSWATGVGLLVEAIGDVSTEATLFIVAASAVVIHRVGTELQQTSSRWTKLIGDLLLWIDKSPVYETPPVPVEPNP